MAETVGILLAAGSARRMGQDKMYLHIGRKSVLERSLSVLEESGCFSLIIIVCRKQDMQKAEAVAKHTLHTAFALVAGGSERQYSMENALNTLSGDGIVAVHDGARCFVNPEVIRACVEEARATGAAAVGVKTRDTIKTIENGVITGTVDREKLVNIQTPQAFRISLLKEAHEKARTDGFIGTDECSLFERLGKPVSFVEAHYDNIKITTQEDVMLGRHIAGEHIRTGTGYDAHRLVSGRPLILGGVHIPHPYGLEGHSDADVLIHAVIDALLGAAAAGDIGTHFPGTDLFRGISSITLLEKTRIIVSERGFSIINVDATVVMERPKLAAYITEMRSCIAQALNINIGAVSVKATTTEGMGFEGTGEGASAMAIASLVG